MKEKTSLFCCPQHTAGTSLVLREQLAKESEGEGEEECPAADGHLGAVLGSPSPILVHPRCSCPLKQLGLPLSGWGFLGQALDSGIFSRGAACRWRPGLQAPLQ